MKDIKRLIDCTKSDFLSMNAKELKESIFKSEGRVIMAQHLVMAGPGILKGITNAEVLAAFGADMIMLNTYHVDGKHENPGMLGLDVQGLKALINRPVGIYLGCPKKGEEKIDSHGPLATEENIIGCMEEGANFIILGGNPGAGTTINNIIESTKLAKSVVGDRALIFSGKWEDGITEKVLGDPLAERDAKDIIKELIDAGTDVIDLPAPGSRHGITVEMIRELIEFTHRYKPGTLAMSFLNSSVEGADTDTIRYVALKMKETGADIHTIGDGGFSGCAHPENVMQLSVSIRGKRFTYKRMAGNNR